MADQSKFNKDSDEVLDIEQSEAGEWLKELFTSLDTTIERCNDATNKTEKTETTHSGSGKMTSEVTFSVDISGKSKKLEVKVETSTGDVYEGTVATLKLKT